MEINSFPDRLDLNDIYTKMAKEKNIKFVINTDAHNILQVLKNIMLK